MEKIDSQYSPSLLSHPDSERVELKRKLLITSAGLEFENSIFVFTVFQSELEHCGENLLKRTALVEKKMVFSHIEVIESKLCYNFVPKM